MWNNTNWLNWPWQRNSANCYNKHCLYERYKLLWRTVAAKGITTVVHILMINSVFTIWITISVQFANMAILFRPIGSQNIKLVSFSIFWFWASPDEDYSRNVSCTLNLIYTFHCYEVQWFYQMDHNSGFTNRIYRVVRILNIYSGIINGTKKSSTILTINDGFFKPIKIAFDYNRFSQRNQNGIWSLYSHLLLSVGSTLPLIE